VGKFSRLNREPETGAGQIYSRAHRDVLAKKSDAWRSRKKTAIRQEKNEACEGGNIKKNIKVKRRESG